MPASEDFTPLDTLKRYLSAPRRMVGEGLESLATLPQRLYGASEQMRTEGPYNPAPAVEAALMTMGTGAMAGVKAAPGEAVLGAGPIRAYHSSPHDFDKFDLARIGTGEGAQVYGHGLYFAENPAVSGQGGQYWNQFLPRFKGTEKEAADLLKSNKFDRDAAIKFSANKQEYIQKALDTGVYPAPAKYGTSRDYYEGLLRDEKARRDLLTSGKPVGPRTYEVNINADPAHMLDWDKRFFGQSPEVQEQLRSLGINPPEKTLPGQFSPLGSSIYGDIARKGPQGFDKKVATEMLNEAGIPGIKYLDQGSRNATPIVKADKRGNVISSEYPPPTSNYVVFDPTILDIVKKYGLAGLASAPALTSGLRDRENQP